MKNHSLIALALMLTCISGARADESLLSITQVSKKPLEKGAVGHALPADDAFRCKNDGETPKESVKDGSDAGCKPDAGQDARKAGANGHYQSRVMNDPQISEFGRAGALVRGGSGGGVTALPKNKASGRPPALQNGEDDDARKIQEGGFTDPYLEREVDNNAPSRAIE